MYILVVKLLMYRFNVADYNVVYDNIQYRFDCPACGGKKTLSITKSYGEYKYHCFRQSCNLRGIKNKNRTIEEIKNKPTQVTPVFEFKNHFQYGITNDKVNKTLQKYYALDAYLKRYIDIGYDPKEDRLLFFMKLNDSISGAVGRALSSKVTPKSKIYAGSKGVFSCGIGHTCVLVEDCLSACSLSRCERYTGISLNGTNITPDIEYCLTKYNRIGIALDKDATRKSIKLNKYLRFLGYDSYIIPLQKDIKDMKELEI